MRVAGLGIMALLCCAATPISAQRLSVAAGAQAAFGEYREQANFLQFRGFGPAGTLGLEYGDLSLEVAGTRLSLEGDAESSPGLDHFTLTQLDARVAVRVISFVHAEAGVMRRMIEPERAAQEATAFRLGLKALYPLAPGAAVAVRSAYLAGRSFTGGGSAPFGIEIALGASYGPGSGRLRVTADYAFQRIDRRTEIDAVRLEVPIQSAIARLGLGVRF